MAQESDKPDTPAKVKNIKTANKESTTKNNETATRKVQRDQQVLEINAQMTSLESAIDKLNKKLNTTNRTIKADVKRLTESDADITDKVGETYKKLGSIETDLTDLNSSSSKVAADLKKVNTQVKKFEKQSAAALKTAIEQQSEVNLDLKTQNEEIVERAEKLSKKATTINTKLNKSIRDNRKALTELEARMVAELESVADASQQRDSDLDGKIEGARDDLANQKAKMLMLQRVDEALEKRAAALETTADKLLEDSDQLKLSTDTLDVLTSKLVSDVDALEQHTAKLAEENRLQQGYIDTLQEQTESLDLSQQKLARTERRHFGFLGLVSLLIIAALVGFYLYSQQQRDEDLVAQGQQDAVAHEQVAKLQTQVQKEQVVSRQLEQEIAELQQNIEGVKQDMLGMTDQVESLDGRVGYIAPLYSFGSDNTIRGPHSLTQLKPEQFAIRVATVSDQNKLYETAQRYSGYLQDSDLSYFVNAEGQYVLVYGGDYSSQEEVVAALEKLPRFINFEKTGIIANNEILEQLK